MKHDMTPGNQNALEADATASLSYWEYYRQGFTHSVGFMPTPGGTGSGKTRGIVKFLQSDVFQQSGKKAAYISNRHNLLIEFARDLEAAGIKYVYLKGDRAIIIELTHKEQLPTIIADLASVGFLFPDQAEALYQLYNRIKRLTKHLAEGQEEDLLFEWRKKRDELCLECYNTFREQLRYHKGRSRRFFESLLENEAIWKVFPYIQYMYDPDARVLLGTIQKLMRGFFDGSNTLKLTSIQGRILFLDEFDFLENEMLKILSEGPSINNPVEFVRIFNEGYRDWQNAEFWEMPDMLRCREQFDAILQFIESRSVAAGFNFPAISRFRMNETLDSDETLAIFQTNRIIPITDFYFHAAGNAWNITKSAVSGSFAPGSLFSMLQEVIQRILDTFNYYRTQDTLRRDITQYIWNPKNDNQAGVYQRYLEENHWYSNANQLLVEPIRQSTYNQRPAYETGFRYIRLFNQVRSDPASMDLDQTELAATPEAVIAKVAKQNLVFALSATMDIPRAVRNFDYTWLRTVTNFIEPDAYSKELVKKLKDKKGSDRSSQIKLIRPDQMQLPDEHLIRSVLEMLKSENYFVRPEDEFPDVYTINHRKDRVLGFFMLLRWVLNESRAANHLVFYGSMIHISNLFKLNQKTRAVHPFLLELLAPQSHGVGYQATFEGKTFNIVFLNKDKAEEIEEVKARGEEKGLLYYKDLFTDSAVEKTIVVTQYKTASNGVNLECWNKEGKEEDFTGIHLLEPEYFWFLTKKENRNDKNPEKQAIWYSWKLLESGQIRWWKFRQILKELDFQKLNGFYRYTQDCTKNEVALYYQALGRIDRKWQPTPLVEVSLAGPILAQFYNYLTQAAFEAIREEREDYTSILMVRVHEEILKYYGEQQFDEHFLDYDDIKQTNDEGKAYINMLLDRIEKLKKEALLPEQAIELREGWQGIREYVLKGQFLFKVQFQHNYLPDFESVQLISAPTRFLQPDNSLHISGEDLRIYPHKPLYIPTFTWHVNRLYEVLQHPAIRDFFKNKGYALQYTGLDGRIWTPYGEQAILAGAIGEKAIQALLEYEGIYLEEEAQLRDALFEVMDAKLKYLPIYIDFKNFRPGTLEKFAIPEDDPAYDPKFDSSAFLAKLQQKVHYIRERTGVVEAKLVVINLLADEKADAKYYNLDLERVHYYEEYAIAIIPSAIAANYPTRLSPDFELWANTIKRLLPI